jgi:hypothetical protein
MPSNSSGTIIITVRMLKIFTVIYLLLPSILFHYFWFRWEIAIVTILGLLISLFSYINNQRKAENGIIKISFTHAFFLIFSTLFLTIISGIGGLSYQTNDYVGHHSKLYDLFKNNWPIYFEGADTFGCYYWGFYLVPALISKLIGGLSVTAFFMWAFLGIFLGVMWVFALVKQNVLRLLLFFCIGGMGHTVKVLYGLISGFGFDHPIVFIEVWNMLNQLLWAPNQFIAALLIASLVYYDGVIGRKVFVCFFPLTLGLIWSVFPTIVMGFILLFIWLYLSGFRKILSLDLKSFTTVLAIPALVCVPVLVYFMSSSGIPIRGFLWTFEPIKPIIADYLVCVVLDVLVLVMVWQYWISNRKEFPNRMFIGLGTLILFFGLYRFGFANDWLVRGTMPMFMMLFFALLRGTLVISRVQNANSILTSKLLVAGLILLCLVGPFSYIYRGAKNNILLNVIKGDQVFKPYPYDRYANIYEAVRLHHSEAEGAQYLGNKNSLYWKYLTKTKP